MPSVTIKEYFALAGSVLTSKDAKVIGPVLSELADAGDVTPASVVEAAHSSNSPLHGYFEWNDRKAGQLYRETQASEIIRVVKVRVVENGREFAHRAFKRRVTVDTPEDRRGNTTSYHRDVEINIIAASAVRDLDAWKLKYADKIRDFPDIAKALRVVANQISEFQEDFAERPVNAAPTQALTELTNWRAAYEKDAESIAAFGDHMEWMMEAIDDAMKHASKLLKNTTDKRKCLSCGTMFYSTHIGNRMCGLCSRKGVGATHEFA